MPTLQTTQVLTHTYHNLYFVATCPECGAPLSPAMGRHALFECGACGWLDLDEEGLDDYLAFQQATHTGRHLC